MELIEEIQVFETSRAARTSVAHVHDLSMQCNNTAIGTCNAVKTETIDGGVVENGPSLYSWESQWRRVMLTRVTSAAPLVLHLIAWEL